MRNYFTKLMAFTAVAGALQGVGFTSALLFFPEKDNRLSPIASTIVSSMMLSSICGAVYAIETLNKDDN